MSDTLKIDRALLERLAPDDPAYLHHGTIEVCWFCDKDNGYDELHLNDHDNDCPWVAARALLDAPRPDTASGGSVCGPAAIMQSEVFAVDPERMTLLGNNSLGERRTATLTAGEWAQIERWTTEVGHRFSSNQIEMLGLSRRILDERGEPVE